MVVLRNCILVSTVKMVQVYLRCSRVGRVTQAPASLLWLETEAGLSDQKEKICRLRHDVM